MVGPRRGKWRFMTTPIFEMKRPQVHTLWMMSRSARDVAKEIHSNAANPVVGQFEFS